MSLNHKHLATAVLALGVLAGMARAEIVTSSEGAGFGAVLTGIGGESVDVTGSIHVVALVTLPGPNFPPTTFLPLTFQLNLEGVKAIGRSTGFKYVVNSSATITTTIPLPATIGFVETFFLNLYQPNPRYPPQPWTIGLSAIFDTSGKIAAMTITGIG